MFDLIRIAWRSRIDSPDTTYAYAILFMFSLLEPELGIFLACLPLSQPVLRAIFNSSIVTRSFGKVIDSEPSQSGTADFGKHNISSGNQNDFVRFPGDGDSSVGLCYEAHGLVNLDSRDDRIDETDVIHVKQTWRVDSQKTSSNN